MQEYVELIKAHDTAAALAYARHHLVPFAVEHLPEFKAALALLVFGPGTCCARYQALLSEERWHMIADVFLADLLRTHNLSPMPMLEASLQVRTSGACVALGRVKPFGLILRSAWLFS